MPDFENDIIFSTNENAYSQARFQEDRNSLFDRDDYMNEDIMKQDESLFIFG